jgi:glycosyltransferase involved in cell wall biosynthesis
LAPRTLIVVPTYNERAGLREIVEAVRRAVPPAAILIVDDASPDGTGALADELARADPQVRVKHRARKEGLGRAYLDAFRQVLDEGWDRIVQMDADFSHDPAALPQLLTASAAADLVIGSRYVPGGELRNWPAHRVMLSTFANWYVRAITRLPVHDCTSGFRCWTRSLLARLPLDRIMSDGYAFQVEMAWEAHTSGGRILEVPITFVERREGQSKMSGLVIAESIVLPWRLIARPRRRSSI